MVMLVIDYLRSLGIDFGFFRLLNYITFRAIMGMTTALLFSLFFGFRYILFLYRKKLRDSSGDILSLKVFSKRGTPTGGGLLIISSALFSLLLWADWNNIFMLVLVCAFVYFGLVGFIDDFQKSRLRSSLSGLSQLWKTILLLLFIVPFALFFVSPVNPVPPEVKTLLWLPFYKFPILELSAFTFILFAIFVQFSIINAINITDGMDGLLPGISALNLGVYAIFAYIIGNAIASGHYLFPHIEGAGEISVFGATLIGALLGFLWFNTYPAEVFMGDTGSLSIGGALAIMSFFTKQELLFPIVGGIFVLEIFSALIQEKVGTPLGRRIFYRAPFHYTLTHRGIPEPKAVVRLWIISILLALVALLSLKVR
ncbi:phospho-N-acetylmuramoyl-pentapeptide-transferase [bacterium]|nr:phospho-N-acetylmuramoyl-pentapeptide-transferase [bacterium]